MSGAAVVQKAIQSKAAEPKAAAAGAAAPAVPADAAASVERRFDPRAINLADGYPPSVAVLRVYACGAKRYGVVGHHRDAELPPLPTREAPTRPMQIEELTSRDFFDLMTEFSSTNVEIRKWLKEVRKGCEANGQELLLLIADHTVLGIPWEMFRLANTSHDCLGSWVTTARWTKAIDDADEDVLLTVGPDECSGGVVAYIDPDERGKITADLQVVDELAAADTHDDLCKFQNLLKEERGDCGLVYLLCHGFIAASVLDMQLGSRLKAANRVRLAVLRRLAMRLLQQSQSVVFLNACDTGRPVEDRDYLCDHHRRDFCEMFLGKGARGVVATLDKVEVGHAARVAREFLELALEHPDWPVARLLRELRRRAVQALAEDPTDEQLERWFYTFLYVYYGNPLTVLRLK